MKILRNHRIINSFGRGNVRQGSTESLVHSTICRETPNYNACDEPAFVPPFVFPDDHSRITLKVENSQGNSDYINASPIVSTPSAF